MVKNVAVQAPATPVKPVTPSQAMEASRPQPGPEAKPTPTNHEPDGAAIALAINMWAKGLNQSKVQAQDCAVKALAHTYNHRDAVYLNRMLEVISAEGKDYIRKTPFLAWLKEFAPVKMVEGIVVFDKDSELSIKIMPEAKAAFWWKTVKEVVVSPFTSTNVYAAAIAAVTKFQNGEKYEAEHGADKTVRDLLAMLQKHKSVVDGQGIPPV